MAKDVDKRSKKQHGRKRRIQLDEDESVSYYRQFVSASLANPTTSQSVTKKAHVSKNPIPGVSTASADRPSTSTTDDTSISKWSDEQTKAEEDKDKASGSKSPQDGCGSSSPEPNCAICLGKLENKSFTDSCFHQFCFDCLVEWSKVKAECPLCKQPFKSIVHNVRSYKDYDQYHIPRPEECATMAEHLFGDTGGVRFRFRTTVTDHRYAHVVDRINREIESRLLQRPSRSSPMPNYRRLRQPANSEFRRRIYEEHLQLNLQEHNTRRRVRETSPSFYQNNPAQTHRLVPWLNRELNALLPGGEQVAFILDLIVDLIKRYPIDSEEFYQHVLPYTGRHTRQFVREFMMFARSPYHMAAYDRHCSYEPSNDRSHDSESDQENDASRNDLSRNMNSSPLSFAPTRRHLIDPFGFAPLYGIPGSSVESSSSFMNPEPPFPYQAVTDPASTVFYCPRIVQQPSASSQPITQTEPIVCDETESDSSSTDIEIVQVEKPWHERSPIQLSSNDDCDSDIMITGTTYVTDPIKKEKKKKKKKDRRDSQSDERRGEKRKRDKSTEARDVKRIVSGTATEELSESRSRSVSPLRLTIIRSPDYHHKKFMYKSNDGRVIPRNTSNRELGLSSTESDSESHLSITSRRCKSKSNKSSIEIVEYRKKKSKKNKKHKKSKKYDEKIDNNENSDSRHHKKKRKKSHKLDRSSSRSGHSSSGSHTKHRHKTKKKKHNRSSTVYPDKNSSAPYMRIRIHEEDSRSIGNIYTSDSDGDSDIDVETIHPKSSDPATVGDGLAQSNVEFVELNPAQAAVIDKELDQINKTLENNDYISSLMSGGDHSAREDGVSFENNDPNRLVNPDDVLNLRSFKKHPYGHKKSSKNKQTKETGDRSLSNTKHTLVSSIAQLSRGQTANAEDNIQISDISSCTDTDVDRQLPSFLTFSSRNSDLRKQRSRMSNLFDNHRQLNSGMLLSDINSPVNQFRNNGRYDYESPTSSSLSYVRPFQVVNRDADVIDVETISSDSDTASPTRESNELGSLKTYEPSSSTVLEVNSKPDYMKEYKKSNDSLKFDDNETGISGLCSNDTEETVPETYLNPVKSYKTCGSSGKTNRKKSRSHSSNSSCVDFNEAVNNDDDDNNDVDVVSDDHLVSYDHQSMSEDRKHDTDIDIEKEDSDLECSVVESYKTFEVDDDDTDIEEVIIEGDGGVDIDVIGCSDEEINVEDIINTSDEKLDISIKSDSSYDKLTAITSTPFVNEDQDENTEKLIDGKDGSNSESSDEGSSKNELDEEEKCDSMDAKETKESETRQNTNCNTAGSSATTSFETTVSQNQSSLSWTSQSLSEARQNSLSGFSDSMYQEWPNESPGLYDVGSPSIVNVTSSLRYGSPVPTASPEWLYNPQSPAYSEDELLQPED